MNKFFLHNSYLSIVKAVIVSTDAFADSSQTDDCRMHIVVSKGYWPGPVHKLYISNGRPEIATTTKNWHELDIKIFLFRREFSETNNFKFAQRCPSVCNLALFKKYVTYNRDF